MKKISTYCVSFLFGLVSMIPISAQNGADILLGSGPCETLIPLICASGVEHPAYAVDDDLNTYATMKTELGVLSSSYLKVGFSHPAPQGSIVAFFVASDVILNADVLQTISLHLYNGADMEIANKPVIDLVDVELTDNDKGLLKIRVPRGETATSAKITVGSLLSLDNEVKVFGAVHAPNIPPVFADYVYDAGPCNPITLGCNSGVINAVHVVDDNRNNFAAMVIPLGIVDQAYLDLGFSTPAPSGRTVMCTFGTNGTPLGIDLLSRLRITLIAPDGHFIRNKWGLTLAEVELLDNFQFKVKVKVPATETAEVGRVRITLSSAVGVLSEVLVYHTEYYPPIHFTDYFRFNASAPMYSLDMYPNPVTDALHITWENPPSGELYYDIYSMDGTQVLREMVSADQHNIIDVHSLQSGIYIIKAVVGDKAYSDTFVVAK